MAVRDALKSQYHAALSMLRQTIERCPEDLWLDETPENAFWHVAYHALFYGHLFLVCVLLAYFPFSKLKHTIGTVFSKMIARS